ncbi:MAG: hypothetical protein OXN93_08725, partial [bacterium]|nr:hypothetical protein [bacterium]
LLGISGGPAAPVAMAFNVSRQGNDKNRDFYQANWPHGVERFRVTGVRLHGTYSSDDLLKARVYASITVYTGLGADDEVPVWGAYANRVWALFNSSGSYVNDVDQIVVRDGPIYERSGSDEPVVVQVTWERQVAGRLACELHIEAIPA